METVNMWVSVKNNTYFSFLPYLKDMSVLIKNVWHCNDGLITNTDVIYMTVIALRVRGKWNYTIVSFSYFTGVIQYHFQWLKMHFFNTRESKK